MQKSFNYRQQITFTLKERKLCSESGVLLESSSITKVTKLDYGLLFRNEPYNLWGKTLYRNETQQDCVG